MNRPPLCTRPARRQRGAVLPAIRFAGAWLAIVTLAGACGSDEPRVAQFSVRVASTQAPESLAAGFVTDQGEEVRLVDLQLSLGPVYVIEERSLYAKAEVERASLVALAAQAWAFLLPAAHAHGTHDFAPTTVVGESLGARVWSVAAGAIDLSSGVGIEVPAGSVDIELRPSPADSTLAGHAAALTFAVRHGEAEAFVRAHFDWDVRAAERTITSIPAEIELRDGGVLTLALDPAQLFDGISFAALFEEPLFEAGASGDGSPLESSQDAPFALRPDGPTALATLHTALQRRLLSVGPWQVRFTPAPGREGP